MSLSGECAVPDAAHATTHTKTSLVAHIPGAMLSAFSLDPLMSFHQQADQLMPSTPQAETQQQQQTFGEADHTGPFLLDNLMHTEPLDAGGWQGATNVASSVDHVTDPISGGRAAMTGRRAAMAPPLGGALATSAGDAGPRSQQQQQQQRRSSDDLLLKEADEAIDEPVEDMSTRGMSESAVAQQPLISPWLRKHYEYMADVSLPRQLFYEQYREFCEEQSLEPLNAASFGKVFHQVFPHIKTRRLGERGHSRYYYQGVNIKSSSPFAARDSVKRSLRIGRRPTRAGSPAEDRVPASPHASYAHAPAPAPSPPAEAPPSPHPATRSPKQTINPFMTAHVAAPSPMAPPAASQQSPLPPPQLITLQSQALFHGGLANDFALVFRPSSQTLFASLARLDFFTFKQSLVEFWIQHAAQLPNQLGGLLTDMYYERLSTYSRFVYDLLPSDYGLLRFEMVHQIRLFTSGSVLDIASALSRIGLPQAVVSIEVKAIECLLRALTKGCRLDFIAQTVRQRFTNQADHEQMRSDWQAIDTNALIKETVSLCQVDEAHLRRVFEMMSRYFEERRPFDDWVQLVYMIADDPGLTVEAARRLILITSHASTLALRELTVSSAPSFGLFQLARTFGDELLGYLVCKKFSKNVPGHPPLHPLLFEFSDSVDV